MPLLIRRVIRELAVFHPQLTPTPPCACTKGHMSTENHLQPLPDTNPDVTLIWDFQSPEPQENKFLLLKATNCSYFIMEAD
jgi:hypothetical protein